MTQLSLVIFKPDVFEENGIENNIKEKFLDAVKENGLEVIVTGPKFIFTEQVCEEHYGHVKAYGPGIYEATRDFMISAESQPMIISGEDAILKVRKIIGPTRMATEGLRATSESATKDSPKNYVHASGIAKGDDPFIEAKQEIARFFPEEYKKLIKDAKYSEFFA